MGSSTGTVGMPVYSTVCSFSISVRVVLIMRSRRPPKIPKAPVRIAHNSLVGGAADLRIKLVFTVLLTISGLYTAHA